MHPNASAARIAYSTARWLSIGSAPGNPRHTGQTWVLGGAPNAVSHPQKILVVVRSCAWISRPMTASSRHPSLGRRRRRGSHGARHPRGPAAVTSAETESSNFLKFVVNIVASFCACVS